MSGENILENEAQEQTIEPEEARQPVDIAEAFRMYNQAQREAAQSGLDDSEDEAGTGEGEAGVTDVSGADSDVGGSETAVSDLAEPDDGSDNGDGGYSDLIEPIDLSPQKESYLKNIQAQAVANVQKKMADEQIELWTMEDIYERDENTGRVTFRNPDDPNRPFQSRAEAQQFINAMNQEVNNYFRREVNIESRKLVQQQAPVLQMFDFAPVYQAMDKTEQEMFNILLEPYAIYNDNNKVIGFNTNLQAIANTARLIVKRMFNNNTASVPQAASKKENVKPSTKPALDMKTGNGATDGEVEPKTLGEALKMYDAQQREANKKKGK